MQKLSNVQDTIQPIPGLISCPGVTGRWGLLSHAQNTYTFAPSSASIGTKLYPHGFLVLLQAQFNRKTYSTFIFVLYLISLSITFTSLYSIGYRIVGTHSGVKLCRWTKSMLRGRGGCYTHTFYGIESHRCMETTPSLACANKCVFCWRYEHS